jgi:hypothetical protein
VKCGRSLARVVHLPANTAPGAKTYKITLSQGSATGSHMLKVLGRASTVAGTSPVGTTSPSNPTTTITTTTTPVGSPNLITRAATFPVDGESVQLSSVTVDPQKVGDLLLLGEQVHSTAVTVMSVSGGHAGRWRLAYREVDSANALTYEAWYAVATNVGSAAINVTYAGDDTGLENELLADSFTSSQPATWVLEADGGESNTDPTTTAVTYPTLASGTAASQLYWGASEEHTQGGPGSTPGFEYGVSVSPGNNEYCDDPALAPSTSYTPTAVTEGPAVSTTIGLIFAAA